MDPGGDKKQIMILGTKGEHWDNPETKDQQKVLEVCANAFMFENVTNGEDVELVVDQDTTISCTMIFEGEWKTD